MSWIEFWDTQTTIYVNDRHKQVHYQQISDDIAALLPNPAARVLDVGCGEALAAAGLAEKCGRLVLSDAAPAVLDKLQQRYGGNAKIAVMAPAEIEAMRHGSFDLIVVNSVIQYLTRDQFTAMLVQWRHLLAPHGMLVLGDVLPHNLSMLSDVSALLKFAYANQFAVAASAGLVKTLFSDYRKKRAELGLLRFDDDEICGALLAAGFSGPRQRANLGHNQNRMTVTARFEPGSGHMIHPEDREVSGRDNGDRIG